MYLFVLGGQAIHHLLEGLNFLLNLEGQVILVLQKLLGRLSFQKDLVHPYHLADL